MKIINFLNLTNGIEYLNQSPELTNVNFLRIESTTVERKNWFKLFYTLDANFLINLALGNKCIVYDKGTNKKNSKSCYYALPLIKYVLNRLWYDIKPDSVFIPKRNKNESDLNVKIYFDQIYNNLFKHDQTAQKRQLRKKLSYYKKFLNSNKVHLDFICESTSDDGKYEIKSKILQQWNALK